MLVEKQGTTQNRRIAIGETVKVTSSGQVGQVTGYEGGYWLINIGGTVVRATESQLKVKEILYG